VDALKANILHLTFELASKDADLERLRGELQERDLALKAALLAAAEERATVGVVRRQLRMWESASQLEHVEEVSRLRNTSSQRIRQLEKRLEESEEEVGKLQGLSSECCRLRLELEQQQLVVKDLSRTARLRGCARCLFISAK
jgi:hypothetical protein